jgi:hypothetical protein
MGIGIVFDPMIQVDDNGDDIPGGKIIDVFDACFGNHPSSLQCIDPIKALEEVRFDDDPDRTLCSNEHGKLDLSIHPPETIPGGKYVGHINILARSVHSVCDTDQETH